MGDSRDDLSGDNEEPPLLRDELSTPVTPGSVLIDKNGLLR